MLTVLSAKCVKWHILCYFDTRDFPQQHTDFSLCIYFNTVHLNCTLDCRSLLEEVSHNACKPWTHPHLWIVVWCNIWSWTTNIVVTQAYREIGTLPLPIIHACSCYYILLLRWETLQESGRKLRRLSVLPARMCKQLLLCACFFVTFSLMFPKFSGNRSWKAGEG